MSALPGCYWCAAPATSQEHVPPRCIFPEAKDVADGSNYRQQLMTVPSCDLHNSAKSADDEYLLGVLTLNILNNPQGQQQARSKVIRALERSPGLKQRLLGDTREIVVEDSTTGEMMSTAALRLEPGRIDRILEHVARALHFYHFSHRWAGRVKVRPEFYVFLEGADTVEKNEELEIMRNASKDAFLQAPYYGSNPDIFQYQVLDCPGKAAPRLMRLSFYEGSRAMVWFFA